LVPVVAVAGSVPVPSWVRVMGMASMLSPARRMRRLDPEPTVV
jgi:hypothetical protein